MRKMLTKHQLRKFHTSHLAVGASPKSMKSEGFSMYIHPLFGPLKLII